MSTKVFVGNLSFKTREPELAKFFETIGPVKSTNIIARGVRSLGYGFVEFEKIEDANKSIEELNKKELDGRPINVEFARPRTEPVPGASPATGEPNAVAAGGASRRFRPRRPMGGFGRRGPRSVRGGAAAVATEGGAAQQPAAAAGGDQPAAGAGAPNARPRGPRRRPQRQPRNTGPPSTTTLFVANLPFVVDDAGLLEIFEGMNVKEAHVVRRTNGRSKGYGFVTFANEADQKRALEQVDKTVVEGRDITVRPALTPVRDLAAPATDAAAKTPETAPKTPTEPAHADVPTIAAPESK